MSETEEKVLPKGYIVRLYKRITNISKEEIIDGSMFMTWMNFDCMDIVPVQNFQNFNNSIDLNKVRSKEKYASRQKFFLYYLDKESESTDRCAEYKDFLSVSDALREFPLITLTMLDIQQDAMLRGVDKCKSELQDFLMNYMAQEDFIKGQVYGSLSLYDYVVVLRGNDYRKMDDLLVALKEKMNLAGIIINKMYTIAGIDYREVSAWNVNGLNVSVRLSCTSDITGRVLREDPKLNAALDIREIYSTLGKYDFDIIGEVKSAKNFVELFLADGSLSAKRRDIHKSNTHFLNLGEIASDKAFLLTNNSEIEAQQGERLHIFSEKEYHEPCSANINDEILAKFLRLYSQIDGLSPSIQEAFSRLILRTFQVIITTNNPKMENDLTQKLYDFLDFIDIHQKKTINSDMAQNKIEDVYSQMIETFNLFLDNRVSAGMSDFETPQNVLRYSGSSMKILLAYSDFVESLVKILNYNKENERNAFKDKERLRYLVFVTADPVARISAMVSLNYSEQYRFINIKVPVDLMFEIKNVLPWITHEVGHFIRAGWKRKERNAAYYTSVARAIIRRMIPFADTQIDKYLAQNADKICDNKGPSLKIADEDENDKFEAYRKDIRQTFQTIIYECCRDYSSMFRIPYNKGSDLFEDVEDITSGMKRVYEESIADMFMLQVLGIKNLEDYLKIQDEYFCRLHIDIARLPQENVSRIMAVSVVLAKLSADDYEGIKDYFSNQYSECVHERIKIILGKLKDYKNYYLLEPLVIFLVTDVEEGLKELLKQKEVAEIWQKIKRSYAKLENGKFEDYIDFVLHFN